MHDNRLLIVDDNKDTCSNLSDILNDCGYSVDVAYRGQDGLDLLKQFPYGLALLDFKLPGMTGVELFTRMRDLHQGIEGLLVTAFASVKTTKEALAAGLQQVVDKPVDVPRLLSLIRQCLGDSVIVVKGAVK